MARDRDDKRDRSPNKQPRADRAKRRAAAANDGKPPADATAPPAKPVRPRRWPRFVGAGAALVIVVLLAVAYLGWPAFVARIGAEPQTTEPDALAETEARLADIEAALARLTAEPAVGENAARIEGLAGRIAALEQAPALVPGLAERLGAVEERIAATAAGDAGASARAGRIDALESTVERLVAKTGEIESRVAAPERSVAPPALGAPALLLAVGPLRAALRGSGPFDAELAAVRAIAGSDADVLAVIDMLAPHAAAGVPTVAVLRARFAHVADQAVRADVAPDEASWVQDWIVSTLTHLVRVRSVGDVPGDGTEAIVARAEARLDGDDLAAAVAEVGGLEGPSAEVMAAWLADARARLAAERALAALEARALAALAAASGGG